MSKNEKYSDKYKKTPKDLPKSKGNRDVISKLLQPVNKDNLNTVKTEIQRNVNEDKQTTGNTEIQQSVNKENQTTVNTEIQESVNNDKQLPVNKKEKSVKKATFELDSNLHMKLKIYAASKDKKMVEVVEEALTIYIQRIQKPVKTEIQENVNKDKQISVNEKEKSVKKATFELDSDLHMKLKIYAASKNKKMVEVVEEALTSFLQQNQE